MREMLNSITWIINELHKTPQRSVHQSSPAIVYCHSVPGYMEKQDTDSGRGRGRGQGTLLIYITELFPRELWLQCYCNQPVLHLCISLTTMHPLMHAVAPSWAAMPLLRRKAPHAQHEFFACLISSLSPLQFQQHVELRGKIFLD